MVNLFKIKKLNFSKSLSIQAMETINFNLRSVFPRKVTTILLIVRLKGKKIVVSTREKILVEDWDKKTQRANNHEKKHVHEVINRRLDTIENAVFKLLKDFENKPVEPNLNFLKQNILFHIENQQKNDPSDYFWKLFDTFVSYKRKSTQSFKEYDLALRKHLKSVERITGIPINFNALHYNEQGFIERFRYYLTHEAINKKGTFGLLTNTIWKQFKNLKAFLNWCFDQNHIPRFSIKHLNAQIEHIDHVYLTNEELISLENLILQEEEKTIRDLFLLSCETGLRFSDLCTLSSVSPNTDFFEVYPKKTRKKEPSKRIIIPFSARVKRVIQTNNGQIPSYSYAKINRFNSILKELCEKAEINSECVHYRIVQGIEIMSLCKKYELVTSHTGRRTFCTLKFLAGMPSHAIMKFSGHSSEQNFLRYLRLDAEIVAHRYRSFF